MLNFKRIRNPTKIQRPIGTQVSPVTFSVLKCQTLNLQEVHPQITAGQVRSTLLTATNGGWRYDVHPVSTRCEDAKCRCNRAELRDEDGDLCFFSLVDQLSEAEKAKFCDLILYQSIKSGQSDEQKMPVWDEVFNAMGTFALARDALARLPDVRSDYISNTLCAACEGRPSSLFFRGTRALCDCARNPGGASMPRVAGVWVAPAAAE